MDDSSALLLDEELMKINKRFESGEMKAFGLNQQKILKELQDIRKQQAQLSMKQVSIGSERIKFHDVDNLGKDDLDQNVYDTVRENDEDLSKLTSSLNTICKNMYVLSLSSSHRHQNTNIFITKASQLTNLTKFTQIQIIHSFSENANRVATSTQAKAS
ncbi:hypothetical protein PPL_02731 [Heterostelium album PN500]|uniref:Uncharacterized protein n=1 Tax=Heterostelium pallidum (strain ATCC 26659 / Pp 5 / PN500) TaxID=670386 RepID=D3B2W7_HETP5|nr:hypothetical protein PPL_02731 [Heterostelium album PN500]EFA83665.1 hypothetical protein PPL_02731 [Heterostelium album PN500]|eukprot:XP_020435782.1 hypothetical protein PPL_02731 [Heterostelium album PN500]